MNLDVDDTVTRNQIHIQGVTLRFSQNREKGQNEDSVDEEA